MPIDPGSSRHDAIYYQTQRELASIQEYYRQRQDSMQQMYSVSQQSGLYLEDKCRSLEADKAILQQKVIELEATIKRFKGGHMARSDYFYKDGTCKDHGEMNCVTCLEEWHDEEARKNSNAIVVATSTLVNGNEGMPDLESAQISAQRTLLRQMRFIKKSLAFTDDQLKKKKIKEIPTLVKKAEDEMTIGGMVELLTDDIKDAGGVIKGMLRFFLKKG